MSDSTRRQAAWWFITLLKASVIAFGSAGAWAGDSTETAREPVDPAVEERLAELREQQRRFLEAHAREAGDPEFGAAWTRRLGESLGRLGADEGFRVTAVSCRSRTCIATVAWSDFARAAQGFTPILHLSAPCHTSTFLEPPEDPTAPYEHHVLYSECRGRP